MNETEKILKRIDTIAKKLPRLAEVLSFGYEIMQLQDKMKDAINNKSLLSLKSDKKYLDKKLNNGEPILDKNDILNALDLKEWRDNYQKILHFIKKKRPQLEESISKIEEWGEKSEIENLIKNYLPPLDITKNNVKETNEYNNILLSFIIENSLKPSGKALGKIFNEIFQTIDMNLWKLSRCPLCGTMARMGQIKGEEGVKYLICGFCETSWSFRRIECPYCENNDQETLKYFQVSIPDINEDSKMRVDVCIKCKRYIKTLDNKENVFEPRSFGIEDLLTLYLDVMAKKEGYETPIPQPLISIS